MQPSQSPADLALELRVLREIEALAALDPATTLTASFVAQRVGASADRVRPILSRLANRGFLRARLEQECVECGSESEDGAGEDSPTERFCRNCGANRRHEPIVVFELGEPVLLEAKPPDPKSQGRPRHGNPLTRPVTWVRGLFEHRSEKTTA